MDVNDVIANRLKHLAECSDELRSYMVAFRNILVHEYIRVSEHIVYNVLKERLIDFDTFAMEVVTWMEGEK